MPYRYQVEGATIVEPDKYWWQSKTILGALAVLIATAVRMIVPDAELEEETFLNLLTMAAQLAGAVLALFGRFKARVLVKPLRGKRK